jgi:endoglycosylceramidase
VNVVYKVAPYIPVTDHWDPQLSLTDKDMSDLVSWGFNVVRLGVMWPAVEPTRGVFNKAYVTQMRSLVDKLGSHGIYTIVDCHQDLYNRKFCGEGAPDWAVVIPSGKKPFPEPVVNHTYPLDKNGYPELSYCLQKNFASYYFSDETGAAFQSLYDDAQGVQTEFVAYWKLLASAFADSEWVLGYELINEPWAGDVVANPSLLVPSAAGSKNLNPMYLRLHTAIRQIDDKHMIFFEKATTNVLGGTGLSVPGGDTYRDRSVYSFHDYCNNVDRSGNPTNLFVCKGEELAQWWQDMSDVSGFGAGSFLTEFGAVGPNNTNSLGDLDYLANLADQYFLSWCYWQFKGYNDFTTCSNEGESLYYNDGTLQKDKLAVLSRPYAVAVAGSSPSMKYDMSTRKLTLSYKTKSTGSQPTDIFIGSITYPNGFTVSLSPANIAAWSVAAGHVLVATNAGVASGTSLSITIQGK